MAIPLLVFLLGEFHGKRTIEGYCPWGYKESDTTERLTLQFSSVTQLCPTLCDHINHSMPGLPVGVGVLTSSWSLLKLMSIGLVMPSNYLILCHALLLSPSTFPSIRIFSNESALHMRWLKYWRFSFSISPSNEHSGLISFRIDWFDCLAVQGILKSFL